MKKTCMVVIAAFALSAVVFASVAWMNTFKNYYKPNSESALGRAKCTICHVQMNGQGDLNSYGKLLKGKTIKPASLKSIENIDADKDGFSNIKEINAGALPGSPDSKPTK